MPGRKSNISMVSVGPEDAAETTPARGTKEVKDGMSVEDLSLPKSMIQRLAKGVLPANTQIQKDALLALHKSATVFVSYLASNSSENAQSNGKKTIAPQDVIAALKDVEFEGFIPRVEAELKKYNDVQCDKRNTYRRKVKEEKAAAAKDGPEDGAQAGDANGHADDGDLERPVKKFKAESGAAVTPDTEAGIDGGDDEEDGNVDDDDDEVEDEDEDGEDDDDEDDDAGEDATEGIDVTMEDRDDDEGDADGQGELRDEALDESDSD